MSNEELKEKLGEIRIELCAFEKMISGLLEKDNPRSCRDEFCVLIDYLGAVEIGLDKVKLLIQKTTAHLWGDFMGVETAGMKEEFWKHRL